MTKIGITTTIPVEIIYAANLTPVDLNNIFITSSNPSSFVRKAEEDGFPRNFCCWVKGIYGVIKENQDIREVVIVTEGDCSNTHALSEVLKLFDLKIHYFSYPFDKNRKFLEFQIRKLMMEFNVNEEKVKKQKERLDKVREKAHLIDKLTWQDNIISGFFNHYFLINCSDFRGNPEKFAEDMDEFLKNLKNKDYSHMIRIGYVGIPPIFSDFYEYLESIGAHIVYNEIARQFSMPYKTDNIIDQYLNYTYPYGIFERLKDIKEEIKRRKIQGIIHYVQSFCFRGVEDIILRKYIDIPILTIEGDRPGKLDLRTKLRLETFINMLCD